MTLQNDNLSSDLIQVLDHLAYDVNRRILQYLYDNGQSTLEAILDHLVEVPMQSISIRLAAFQRCKMVEVERTNDYKKIKSVKLTQFTQILLMNLFFVQMLLEDKN